MSNRASRFAALLLAVVLTVAAPGEAQRAAADEYSDATLEAFVTASFEVSRLIEAWRPQIEGTADEDARNALILEVEADVARTIERISGLSVDTYYVILGEAIADETLRERIQRMVSARQQRPSVPRAE